MCQCLPCECWWCNCFGTCGGLAYLLCFCGYWCCKNEEMLRHNLSCCYCCETSGYGYNCFCYGSVCCAPNWLQRYSKMANGKIPMDTPLITVQSGVNYIQTGYSQPSYNQPGQMQPGYGQPGYANPPIYNSQNPGYNHQPGYSNEMGYNNQPGYSNQPVHNHQPGYQPQP